VSGQRHLVDVWNPSYASNAMEAHLAILLAGAKRLDDGEIADDAEIYVWWGKVRSSNRRQPLGKLDTILAMGAELADDPDREGHLYLTDYRALYVGHIAEITRDDMRKRDPSHVPEYYARYDLDCDFWYRLLDLRRLVADDTLAVIAQLRQLRNTDYYDRPVSLYGGMVDLPLIVTRPDEIRLFEPEVRDEITDEKLWVEFDAEAGGVGAMERELRENLFGDSVWMALEPAARTFIATAEKTFRDHRSDPGADFGLVIGGLAKALEVSCNAIMSRALPLLPPRARQANFDGHTVDLIERKHLMLGQFSRAVGGERELNAALTQRLEHGGWFAGSLPAIVEEVLAVRNPGVHEHRVDRETATRLRDKLMGVGCQGTFAELARVRVKGSR
jgi:hypothetical protein